MHILYAVFSSVWYLRMTHAPCTNASSRYPQYVPEMPVQILSPSSGGHPTNLTLAISPQLLPASRILFSNCSSPAVHGVFVRLLFLAPLSLSSDDTGTEPEPSVLPVEGAVGDDSATGLLEARRLRGFDGVDSGGGMVFNVVLGASGGGGCTGTLSVPGGTENGSGGDSLCRFCGGGDLCPRRMMLDQTCEN